MYPILYIRLDTAGRLLISSCDGRKRSFDGWTTVYTGRWRRVRLGLERDADREADAWRGIMGVGSSSALS